MSHLNEAMEKRLPENLEKSLDQKLARNMEHTILHLNEIA